MPANSSTIWFVSVKAPQAMPFTVTPELEAWLLEAADKPVTPLTKAGFQAI
jgi:hypothetical protein